MNAKVENTARILADKPPIVESWLCRFGFHSWTKWSDPKKNGSSIFVRQERVCIHCNEWEEHKVNSG